jgi:hypothetical protein
MASESTVIYHISQAVKMGHPVGKEIIKLVRSAAVVPEVVFRHFTLYLVSIFNLISFFLTIYCLVFASSDIIVGHFSSLIAHYQCFPLPCFFS